MLINRLKLMKKKQKCYKHKNATRREELNA